MEEIITIFKNLFSTYDFWASAIIILTIIITNIIKQPIIKKAIFLAEKNNYDKSIITKNITFIPLAISFLLITIVSLINNKFNFILLDFGDISTKAIIYSTVSIGIYEAIKKQFEGYRAKKQSTNCN